MRFDAAIFFFGPLVSALAFVGPNPTSALENRRLNPRGWSPRPTEAPEFKELVRRQSSAGTSTLIEAPDSVCGYKFGISNSPLAICGTSRCGFATTPLGYGSVYCFSSTFTQARSWTYCYGGSSASSCLLNSSCKSNSLVAICTGTQSLCNGGYFVGLGVDAIWCDSTAFPGTVTISTTYVGQIGRVLSTVGFLPPSTTSRSTTTSNTIPSSSSTSIPTSSSPLSSSRPISSSTSTQSTSASSSSLSRSATTSPTVSPTAAPVTVTPVGPIVGGAIGGLALLSAIAFGIFFFLRQRKRKNEETIPEISGPPGPAAQANAQGNNIQPQYPSEKYAATTQTTFIPPGSTSAKPEQQFQYQQQPPQPQYQQTSPVTQPYHSYQPVAQQQTSGHQAQQYYLQDAPTQSHHNAVQPQPASHELSDTNRGSIISAVSAPGSPAPPYTGTIPTVPEVPGQASHQARPIPDRYEMPSAH